MKIIILHGLYMHGFVMQPLGQRLSKLGYDTEVLSYNTVAIKDERYFVPLTKRWLQTSRMCWSATASAV